MSNNAILEVAIGLILIYLVVALLATKLQELWFGTYWRGRVKNLHAVVFEAVGRDETLQKRVYENPLVSGLFEGEKATPGRWWERAVGPSAIPPDIFARALLIVIHADSNGRHPSDQYTTPSGFVSEKSNDALQVWKSLRALLPGNEANWSAFEAAIARWFCDITDRSSGWYQRKMQGVGLALAVVLAALLNVDAFYIAESLSSDPQQRRALVALAEDVNRLARQDAGMAAANAPPPAMQDGARAAFNDDPLLLVSTRILQAVPKLQDAFMKDAAIARSAPNLFPVKEHCAVVGDKKLDDSKLSNSDAWLRVLPALRTIVVNSQVPSDPNNPGAPTTLQALTAVHACLVQISSWVSVAPQAKDDVIRKSMQDAGTALNEAEAGLLRMIKNLRAGRAVRAMFHRNPEAFRDCAEQTSGSRALFEECTARSDREVLQFPVLFTKRNRYLQFHTPVERRTGEDFVTTDESLHFNGSATLGLPRMELVLLPWEERASWILGVLASAIFISLGSPFWFGLLEKVMRLRSMGKTREDLEDKDAASGLTPKAPDKAVPAPAPTGGAEPFSFALNEFERSTLVPRDIVAVQQHLGMASQTGQLDTQTRAAIEDYTRKHGLTPTNELDATLFFRITGRQSSATPVVATHGRLHRGEPHPLVPEVAAKLQAVLGLPAARVPANVRSFSDDLRAMAVLYRYKVDAAPDPQRRVFDDALNRPEVLDRIEEDLLDEIRKRAAVGGAPLPADTKPWLEWAIGELGQVERNEITVAASNPRICEYLKAAGLPNAGDATPWCGAFVAWVVTAYNNSNPATPLVPPPVQPALAANWSNWATARPRDAAGALQIQRGDVVLMRSADTDGKIRYHVGFCLQADADTIWLLAGNQASGTRVCLRPIPRQHIEGANGP